MIFKPGTLWESGVSSALVQAIERHVEENVADAIKSFVEEPRSGYLEMSSDLDDAPCSIRFDVVGSDMHHFARRDRSFAEMVQEVIEEGTPELISKWANEMTAAAEKLRNAGGAA